MSWLEFRESGCSSSGRTQIWTVRTTSRDGSLGHIKWFARWRRYAFFPLWDTVFEQDCLREIATFCEQATALHRVQRLEAASE